MAEIEARYMYLFPGAAYSADTRPIPWISADSPAFTAPLLEAQLDYFSRVFDSAEEGALFMQAASYPAHTRKWASVEGVCQ